MAHVSRRIRGFVLFFLKIQTPSTGASIARRAHLDARARGRGDGRATRGAVRETDARASERTRREPRSKTREDAPAVEASTARDDGERGRRCRRGEPAEAQGERIVASADVARETSAVERALRGIRARRRDARDDYEKV